MIIQTPDLINALFESGGALAVANNCYRVYKDKMLKGVSLYSTFFFTGWGIYNIWYYPNLHQTLSFMAGVVLCGMNVTWLVLMFKYHGMTSVPIRTEPVDTST